MAIAQRMMHHVLACQICVTLQLYGLFVERRTTDSTAYVAAGRTIAGAAFIRALRRSFAWTLRPAPPNMYVREIPIGCRASVLLHATIEQSHARRGR